MRSNGEYDDNKGRCWNKEGINLEEWETNRRCVRRNRWKVAANVDELAHEKRLAVGVLPTSLRYHNFAVGKSLGKTCQTSVGCLTLVLPLNILIHNNTKMKKPYYLQR